jgi:predicted nucleotidyltransferase
VEGTAFRNAGADRMKTVTPVANKSEIIQRINDLWPRFSELGIRRIGLFGSFVRGEQTAESDVDLLVEFHPDEKTFRNFMDSAELLEDALGRRIDFITRESLSRHFAPYILREVENVEIADPVARTHS